MTALWVTGAIAGGFVLLVIAARAAWAVVVRDRYMGTGYEQDSD